MNDPLARWLMMLVLCWDERQLFGVRIVGDFAGELIDLGQSVTDAGDTIDWFINTPFAVPTRADFD